MDSNIPLIEICLKQQGGILAAKLLQLPPK